MCFPSAPITTPSNVPAPSTERDATLAAVGNRARRSAADSRAGAIKTGPGGDETSAPIYKTKLGGNR